MELNWREKLFNQNMCSGSITNEGEGDILVEGTIESELENPTIFFWAPAPANRGASFSGSGLPFPNAEMAYEPQWQKKCPGAPDCWAPPEKSRFREGCKHEAVHIWH